MKSLTPALVIFMIGLVQYCDSSNCAANLFSCEDGSRCLKKGFVCDDFPNCLDGSDEDEEFCKTWDYEYEYEEPDSGGWLGAWGTTDPEEDVDSVAEKESSETSISEPSLTQDADTSSEAKSQSKQEVEFCSQSKCPLPGPLSFQSGQKYHYKYDVLSATSAWSENSNQSSSTQTTCDVVIDVLSACEMSMKVENILHKYSTTETNGEPTVVLDSSKYLQLLEKEILRFSMVGGEIEYLCPTEDEDPRALNFKRGILSMIQNSMPQLHLRHTKVEKDVLGDCEMIYEFKPQYSADATVTKTRSIESCKQRSYISSMAQSVPYTFPEAITNLPIVNSTSSCVQQINRGVIKFAECEEEHKVIPLYSKIGGVLTTVRQTLELDQTSFSVASFGVVDRRTDIQFQHASALGNDGEINVGDKVSKFNRIMKLISSSDKASSTDETPAAVFSHLVAFLKHFSVEELNNLFTSQKWNKDEKAMFSDALKMAGTAASLQFMTQEMPQEVAKWGGTLTYILKPDLETIQATVEIMALKSRPDELFLSVGSLLHNYCLQNPTCVYHDPVKKVLESFQSAISANRETKVTKKIVETLFALRGLGNAGLALNEEVLELLNIILLDDQVESELRVTAIETFRRVPCNVSRTSLEKVLLDVQQDSEVRISSYLGLMRCINYDALHLIENIFQEEEINQVGSFIWTHLTNIKETSSPSKIDIQSLLSNRHFQEKFKSDVRKYSRNIEWSGFHDEINAGASVESNIVFSQQSYIPRSTSLNITADLFGRSFNFLELQTHMEGFERLVANWLGEMGSTDEKTTLKSIKNSKIRELVKKSKKKEQFLTQEPKISFDVKLFGHDSFYRHASGTEEMADYVRVLDPLKFLMSIKNGKDFNIKKSVLPIDSSFQLATSAGMPLVINIQGSASVDLSARIEADLFSLMRFQGKISGHLKPTISIDLKASMILNNYATQTGAEMDSAFYSSSVVDGFLEIDKTNELKIDFNLPKKDMKIVKVSSKLSILHGINVPAQTSSFNDPLFKETVKSRLAQPTKSQECSHFQNFFGSNLCWTLEYPATIMFDQKMLIRGPANFDLTLAKSDPTLTSYKIRYHWGSQNGKLIAAFLFDTPGSSVSREHRLNFTMNHSKKDVSFLMKTPDRSFHLKGRYKWEEDERRLDASINLNEREISSFGVGYKLHDKSGQKVLIPTFFILWKNQQLIKVSGSMDQRQKQTGDDTIHYTVNLTFDFFWNADNSGTGFIKGYINNKNDTWDARLDISYTLKGLKKTEHINISYNRIMKLGGFPDKVERSWNVRFTQFPYLNCKGKWSRKSYSGSLENAVKVSFGSDFNNPLHEVTLYQNLIFYGGGGGHTAFNATFAVEYPKNNLDVLIGIDFYEDVSDIITGFVFQYAADEAVKMRFHLVESLSGPKDIKGSWYFVVPDWINLDVRGSIKEVAILSYEFELLISWKSKRLEFTGHYTDMSTRLKSLHEIEMKIKLPSKAVVYTHSTLMYDGNQVVITCQVKTKTGAKYKVRLALISQLDDYSAHLRKIEIDVNLPTQTYYWHSEITFGEFITLSNDIHLDMYRDLNFWLQIQKSNKGIKRIESKFLWDANRDPQKKADMDLMLGEGTIDLRSSIVFLGNEYKFTWKSDKQYTSESATGHVNWQHKHGGEMSWKDETRKIHKISTGASFVLNRKMEGAKFSADIFLTTPFQNWVNNTARVEYIRDSDQILASLKSKWHYDEFLDITYKLTKTVKGSEIKGETKLEVLSLINENPVSLSTGAALNKFPGNLDGNIFIKWDDDRVELRFEAKDESGPDDLTATFSTTVFTTLKGYNHMSTFVDLYAIKNSFRLHSSAKWDDLIYEFKGNGELFSAQEYLKGEFTLSTPTGGSNTAAAKIRVYHNYQNHDENMQVFGKWLDKELTLEGRVYAHPQDFRAELILDTPFPQISQASIILGHSFREHYQTIAQVKWNNTRTLGINIECRLVSLTDFLMSLSVMTPFANYENVQAEVRNTFSVSPEVNVHSRIFGQLAEKKFGIGGKYQHGMNPRLSVGLEFYSPIPNLQEVRFDISDLSTPPTMKYSMDVHYGMHRSLAIITEFEQKAKSLNLDIKSTVDLSTILGPDMSDVKLEVVANISTVSNVDYSFKMGAITNSDNYKIFTSGVIGQDGTGNLAIILALPFEKLHDFELSVDYKKVTHWQEGYLKMQALSGSQSLGYLDISGTLRNMDIQFNIENYRKGSIIYKLLNLDIVRSKLEAILSVENQEYSMDGTAHLNEENFITTLEASLKGPNEEFDDMKVIIEGHFDQDGVFVNSLQLFSNEQVIHDGKIWWKIQNENFWQVKGTISSQIQEKLEKREVEIIYENVNGKPLKVFIKMDGLTEDLNFLSCDLEIQKEYWPYQSKLDWKTPYSAGKAVVVVDDFRNERLKIEADLDVTNSGKETTTFRLKSDLHNRSTKNVVELAILMELRSNMKHWDHFLLDGNLRQVTLDEKGILRVHFEWPQMVPVTCLVEANYEPSPSLNIKISVQLNINTASYGFLGKVKRTGVKMNLSGVLWWKREHDLDRYQISLDSDLLFLAEGLDGTALIKIPIPGVYETNTANLRFRRKENINDISLVIKAGHIYNAFNATFKFSDSLAAEGNITMTSSIFREGHPIVLRFSQVSISGGFRGNYYFEWPIYDLKTETYLQEPVTAKLEHNNLKDGKQGTFQVQARVTKEKPVILSYKFLFPKRPYILVKLGLAYGNVKLELKGEKAETKTKQHQMTKTTVELDNILWPFGVSYIEETFLPSHENYLLQKTSDRLEIYDLDNNSSRSSVALIKESKSNGARLAIKGKFFDRELEISCGYKNQADNIGADLLLSWELGQKLEAIFDWKDQSESLTEIQHLLTAKISHPLRTVILEGERTQKEGITMMNLNFNTDVNNPENTPLLAELKLENQSEISAETLYHGILQISHPSLPSDIIVDGEFKRDFKNPLLFKMNLKYSEQQNQDLVIHLLVDRDLEKRQFTNLLEIVHEESNLQAKASGILTLGSEIYSFEEDFLYSDINGTQSRARIDGGLNINARTFHSVIEASNKPLLHLKMQMKEKYRGHWELLTTSESHEDSIPFNTTLQLHPSQPIFILTIERLQSNVSESTKQEIVNPNYLRFIAEKIIIDGGYEDQRSIHFSMKHLEPIAIRSSWIQDGDFSFRLNHSRLLSSSFIWRKAIEEELRNEIREIIGLSQEIRNSATVWLKEGAKLVGKEIITRSKPIAFDIAQVTAPLLSYFKNESSHFKQDILTLFRSINMTEKERNLKVSIEYTLSNLAESIGKLSFVQNLKQTLAKGTLRTQLYSVIEKIKNFYSYLFKRDLSSVGLVEKLRELMSTLATAYDQTAKRWYLSFRNAVADFNMRLREWLRFKWHSLYENYKPHILKTLHLLESATFKLVSQIWEYMNQLGANLKSMSYVQMLQEVYQKIKLTYNDMSTRTLKQNLEMVYTYAVSYIKAGFNLFIKKVLPFMDDWISEVEKAWKALYAFENVKVVFDFGQKIQLKLFWLLSKIDIREPVIDLMVFSIEHGYRILTQTALDAQIKHISTKTDMNWNPDEGHLKLLQKLPFDWMAFNKTPEWKELTKIPGLSSLKNIFFPSTEVSLLDSWYKYFNLNFYPTTWIPPFPATGYVIGEEHIMTFDGKLINFKGSCEHLLAADLIQGSWAVTIQYNKHAPKIINVYSDHKVIEFSKQYKVKIDGRLTTLPYALPSTLIWRTTGSVNLALDSGLGVSWNVAHDVISITVPRTSFANTAGLLGTNNNEPIDDMLTPDDRTQFSANNLNDFVETWKVSSPKCESEIESTMAEPLTDTLNICDSLFVSKSSPFKHCFYQVNPQPYYEICIRDIVSNGKDATSSVALAYRERCLEHATPVKLPVNYVRCEYTNATSQKVKRIQEGQTVILKKTEIENAADVVILIEMNSCNKALQSKQFQQFIKRFNDGLVEGGAVSTRYAVIAYGGSSPYKSPTLVSTDANIFTSSTKVSDYIQNLKFPSEEENGASNSFDAITYASNLAFRSPVSVVFLLFPCSPCHQSLGLDYSTMYHILLNNAATLYVFKSTPFSTGKQTDQQKILGYDKEEAFLTKHFNKNKMGDSGLKKQIQPPKEELNYCLPLAIETEGAIFTTDALINSKKKLIERFGVIAGRRVAQKVRQEYDQNCLCLSTQEVTPLMRCDKWEQGDFSVLQRYGLEIDKNSSFFQVSDEDQEDFEE